MLVHASQSRLHAILSQSQTSRMQPCIHTIEYTGSYHRGIEIRYVEETAGAHAHAGTRTQLPLTYMYKYIYTRKRTCRRVIISNGSSNILVSRVITGHVGRKGVVARSLLLHALEVLQCLLLRGRRRGLRGACARARLGARVRVRLQAVNVTARVLGVRVYVHPCR